MIGTTRARYSQFQKELPFVESDLITGTTLVQSFYVSQGFPQVQIVKLTTIPDNRTGTVNAIVTIKEGPRFFFGPISFSKNFGIAQSEFSAKIKSLTDPPKALLRSRTSKFTERSDVHFQIEGLLLGFSHRHPKFSRSSRRTRTNIWSIRSRGRSTSSEHWSRIRIRTRGSGPSFSRGVSRRFEVKPTIRKN